MRLAVRKNGIIVYRRTLKMHKIQMKEGKGDTEANAVEKTIAI